MYVPAVSTVSYLRNADLKGPETPRRANVGGMSVSKFGRIVIKVWRLLEETKDNTSRDRDLLIGGTSTAEDTRTLQCRSAAATNEFRPVQNLELVPLFYSAVQQHYYCNPAICRASNPPVLPSEPFAGCRKSRGSGVGSRFRCRAAVSGLGCRCDTRRRDPQVGAMPAPRQGCREATRLLRVPGGPSKVTYRLPGWF